MAIEPIFKWLRTKIARIEYESCNQITIIIIIAVIVVGFLLFVCCVFVCVFIPRSNYMVFFFSLLFSIFSFIPRHLSFLCIFAFISLSLYHNYNVCSWWIYCFFFFCIYIDILSILFWYFSVMFCFVCVRVFLICCIALTFFLNFYLCANLAFAHTLPYAYVQSQYKIPYRMMIFYRIRVRTCA